MDGHPEVGAETLARTLALHRARRCGCCARASTGSRSASRTPRAARPSPPRSRRRWRATPRSCRPRACCGAPTASASRCAPSSASSPTGSYNMLDPLAREPGYADPQELRDDLWLVLDSVGSGHVAHGAIRRLLWQVDVFGFHVAGARRAPVGRRGAGGGRRAAARLPRRGRGRAPAQLLAEAIAEDRRGLDRRPRARRASCCACSTRSPWRARRTARAPCPVMVISMVERAVRRARRAVARRARGRAAAARARCSRRWRTSSDAPETMARSTARPSTATPCAPHGDRQTDHARLLGLGQGLRLRLEPVGAARRPGAAGRPGGRGRARAGALPRPRRLAVARRRAHAPRDPRPAARLAAAGASGSPSRARPSPRATATPSWPCARWSRRSPPCCSPRRASSRRCRRRGARRWSG